MFGRTVNPISTRGAYYAHHSTTNPPKFSDLATALILLQIYLFFMYIDNRQAFNGVFLHFSRICNQTIPISIWLYYQNKVLNIQKEWG
jgi:hypothetical protein